VDRYHYDLWGAPTTGREDVPQPFRYAGYLLDREFALPNEAGLPVAQRGWHWLSVRHYDPVLKRFLQPDPSEQEGTHTYVCAGGRPIRIRRAHPGAAARVRATAPRWPAARVCPWASSLPLGQEKAIKVQQGEQPPGIKERLGPSATAAARSSWKRRRRSICSTRSVGVQRSAASSSARSTPSASSTRNRACRGVFEGSSLASGPCPLQEAADGAGYATRGALRHLLLHVIREFVDGAIGGLVQMSRAVARRGGVRGVSIGEGTLLEGDKLCTDECPSVSLIGRETRGAGGEAFAQPVDP
jgi:RHS repeat-associated protein